MVQIIRSEENREFTCPHCGSIYEIRWSQPAHDSGSIECEICCEVVVRWKESAIPSLLLKAERSLARLGNMAIDHQSRGGGLPEQRANGGKPDDGEK